MTLPYIRAHYRVPAKRGARIRFEDRPGVIVGAQGARLRVRLDGPFGPIVTLHPTWRIDYDPRSMPNQTDPEGIQT